MKNVAFIINPNSAKGNYHSFLNELQKTIKNPLVYISQSIKGTQDFIKKHFEETEIFVAIGGDGTISSVASQLINTEKTLAIFPAGSGNGFSRETGFSKNIPQLLSKLSENKTRKIDTFTINGNFSINVSGAGFDGEVTKEFEKTNRGFFNYIKVSIQTFFRYTPIQITFKEENLKKHNGKYLMLNLANTRQFGNNAYIAPQAKLDDGLIDLVLVKKFPLYHSPLFAYRMFSKNLIANRYLDYLKISEITFETNTQNWHIDGEYKKINSPITIKVLPQSLKILI